MWLGQVFEQPGEVFGGQQFEAGRHDRERRGVQGKDVFALNDMFLRGRIEDFNRSLSFGVEPS